MKKFMIILTFLALFNGCSNKNAFYEFKMDKEQQLAMSNLKSSKIISKDGEIKGIFSAVYLNEVYPDLSNQNETFFVFFFTKQNKKISKEDEYTDADLKILLNSKMPIKIEELEENNRFSHLVDMKNSWNRYYIVTFEKAQRADLIFEDADASSTILKFKK